MNIRDLQYLIAVYDLGSFSKAAETCFVSQPTLSGQLKKLEEDLGLPLMERSTRSVLFTPVGERVVSQARQVIAGVEQIKAIAREGGDPLAGDFHLGLIPTIGPFLLPSIVSQINEQFPRLKLFLHELKTEVLVDRLLNGKLDAAILAKLDWDYPVIDWHLYDEPFLLAVKDDSDLAGLAEPLEEEILAGQSLLMLEDGHCLRDQAMDVCFTAGANEDNRYQATSMDTLMHMVASGHGLTLVPELAMYKPLKGISYKRFKPGGPGREVVMVGRNNGARNEANEELAAFIAREVAQIIGA
jgi:LysR family hydrogen peroxide-inducible transcriptional activator